MAKLKDKTPARITKHFKYVFIDIVGYSQEHIVQQARVTAVLNRLVREALDENGIVEPRLLHHTNQTTCLLLPTGDGVCIALVEVDPVSDIHLTLANSIGRKIYENNQSIERKLEKGLDRWSVRIGVNEGVDQVITDINGRENISGDGINNAQRVMSSGEAWQIIVGPHVYDHLKNEPKYRKAFTAHTFVDKHKGVHDAWRYSKNNSPWTKGPDKQKQDLEWLMPIMNSRLAGRKKSYFATKVLQWRGKRLMENAGKISAKNELEFACRDDYGNMIHTFSGLMGELQSGDRYITLSSLKFWTRLPKLKGNFLEVNVEAAKRGVKIMRLIIFDEQILEKGVDGRGVYKLDDLRGVVNVIRERSMRPTERRIFDRMELYFVPVVDYNASYKDEIPWAMAEHREGTSVERLLMKPLFKDHGDGIKAVKIAFDHSDNDDIEEHRQQYNDAFKRKKKYTLAQMSSLLATHKDSVPGAKHGGKAKGRGRRRAT